MNIISSVIFIMSKIICNAFTRQFDVTLYLQVGKFHDYDNGDELLTK